MIDAALQTNEDPRGAENFYCFFLLFLSLVFSFAFGVSNKRVDFSVRFHHGRSTMEGHTSINCCFSTSI